MEYAVGATCVKCNKDIVETRVVTASQPDLLTANGWIRIPVGPVCAECAKALAPQDRFGTLVADLREKHNVDATEFFQLTGVRPTTLSKIEHGRYENPPLDLLLNVCKAFNMKVSDFLAMLGI